MEILIGLVVLTLFAAMAGISIGFIVFIWQLIFGKKRGK